ncbi:Protein-tyrosine-phosphatase (modular protein) [Rhodospirillaceae bacterium LM-1]|nr:Protein-tyrosine-phosphatase (modular protein) [Rhodospirillaceae bacterium LM-1]
MNQRQAQENYRKAGEAALGHFKGGLFCAESVLLALAEFQDISSDLIPAIATGFCSGMARTCGQCGAVSGAVMGLGLAYGRNRGDESLDQAYLATQRLLSRFRAEYGSTNCAELLGCDLGTPEGYASFKDRGLVKNCFAYAVKATELAAELIEPHPINVLVLCTGNSARSVMGEALINALGEGRWKAFSAGSHPTGQVNPLTLELLAERGHRIDGLRSKSWDEFAADGAPKMDLVITVCDNAAGEICPVWPGGPKKIHLGFPDPAAATGTHGERLAEFRRIYAQIEEKMKRLIELGPEKAGDIA